MEPAIEGLSERTRQPDEGLAEIATVGSRYSVLADHDASELRRERSDVVRLPEPKEFVEQPIGPNGSWPTPIIARVNPVPYEVLAVALDKRRDHRPRGQGVVNA